jgi:hypothetical protein
MVTNESTAKIKTEPQMDTDKKHRFGLFSLQYANSVDEFKSSVPICVHLWLNHFSDGW